MLKIILILLITIIFINPFITTQENFENNNLKIYFINLQENIDRWEKNKNKIHNMVRFNAINGRKIKKDDLINDGIILKENKLLPGQIGCALSHINVMKLIKEQNEEYGLILEDDVILPDNFIKIFEDLKNNFPKKWDVIFLGGCNIYGKKYNDKFIIPTDNSGSKNLCMHAVLLNKKSIDKVISKLLPLYRPIDSQMRDHYNELNVYYTYPNIINQNKELISNRRVIDGLPQSNYWKKHHTDIHILT